MGSKLGAFTGDEARSRFLDTYDRAMRLWPQPYDEQDVETSFGSTRVYGYGTGDGIPVVLLPGTGATPAMWAPHVTALSAHRRVLSMDVLGEPGRSVQTTPFRRTEDVVSWLDAVLAGIGPDEVHLVGASYGGWMALNMAVHTPGRIASVSLLDPARALAPFKPGFVPGAILAMVSGSDSFRRRHFDFLIGDVGEPHEIGERKMDVLLSGMRHYRNRPLPPQSVGDDELRSVTAPALVLLGERSPVHDSRRALARVREFMPAAQAEIVPGARHGVPMDVINTRVPEFIATVEAATTQ
ncbi:alpha/beta fold hydrolase [Streptomyces sp. 8N706]|uniref:alpha/beta fold hydrolase n=1 Tax=Streptomyces sp. 8N706 TaxID=3457416 RepID=UPI003FD534D5